MNNKTFGAVVGVIIALALAMFAGLYMLGLSGNAPATTVDFNEGYEYANNDEFFFDESGEGFELLEDTPLADDEFFYDDEADYLLDDTTFQEYNFDADLESYNDLIDAPLE